jgi:toxin secretion/phage lysis holin
MSKNIQSILSSTIGFRGLMKKAAMLLAVVVAVQLDAIFGNQGQFMRYAMIMSLIGLEGISLVENWGHLGFKVPKIISDSFTQLKNDNGPKTPSKEEQNLEATKEGEG